jgi:glycosyltransferase involved in cell wall biosynthesis
MSPRSVVILNSFCHVQGGASRVAIDEAVGLARRGVAVTFVGAVGPVAEELSTAPLRVVCLGQPQMSDGLSNPKVALQGLWNMAAYEAMKAVLRECDPRETIVHLHGFTQGLSSSPVRCSLARGFRVVCTLHEYVTACPNGAFFDYASESPCSRRPLSVQCLTRNCDKRLYIHKAFRVLRTGVQRSAGGLPGGVRHYIGLSRRSVDVLRPYLPRDARIFFLDNPVEVSQAAPVEVARNRTVVAIGRLDPEKGVQVLIEASRLSETEVLFVGDGPLRPLAERSKTCRVTGWLPRDRVLATLDSARCLAFPSLWCETFGLSVSEAAARGVPAIVSDICGTAERVEHDVTGWHVRAGDVAALAGHFDRIRDDALVAAAGRATYARFWSAPPTSERHTEQLLQIYEQVLRG